jgi:hypothetical protein
MRRMSRVVVLAAVILALGTLQETPAAATGEEGAVYTMSNDADGNTVLVFHRAEDGSLTPGDPVPTDGLGSDDALER